MAEFLRALFQRTGNESDPTSPVRFVASTEGKKSDGIDLKKDDWSLDRYLKHPVILYAHDFMGHNLPLGTGVPSFEGRNLMIDVTFDADDEFAMKVRAKTIKGMMGGSVSWDVVTQGAKKMNELLEFSIVPIPLDPNALPQRQLRGYKNLQLQLSEMLNDANNDSDSDESAWKRTASDMVDLFVSGDLLDENERKARYNQLVKEYRKLGKVAPEPPNFSLPVKQEDFTAEDYEAVRGLFLENEYEMFPEKFVTGERKGAVLNARNRADLNQAIELINGVLERATKEEDTEPRDEHADALRAILETLNKGK